MAAVSSRLVLGTDIGTGEQEKDANSQLIELDKGLRSSKVEEQCEAIVRFPRLFEKFPFPILINSAFLKLSDVFRVGSNFLRLCVLKVTQQSGKHLDKIINVEEFVRRLFSVIHSNDPVARAITLRTLGSCASVIAELKNVHHSIITGLDSHDSIEVEAAIYAANHFAAKSKHFASSICNKLAEMIKGLATPVELKLKLMTIFEHMHHDAASAAKVRELFTGMLPSYPSQAFILVALHTLTQLAASSLQDIPDQVMLLLDYVINDPRKAVKTTALQNLALLAHKAPHMWTSDGIDKLCQLVLDTPYAGIKIGALRVLTVLSSTSAVTTISTEADSKVLVVCSSCNYHPNIEINVLSVKLLTDLACYKDKGKSGEECELSGEVSIAMETLIITSTSDTSPKCINALKNCLHSVVGLCLACPQMTDQFVDFLISTLPALSGKHAVLLCECLAAISSHRNNLLQGIVRDIVGIIKDVSNSKGKHREKLLVTLVTLLFQACVNDEISDDVHDCILQLMSSINAWSMYKMGRQAARYGHHKTAAAIFTQLAGKVSTEHFYFWMSALRDCSLGESCLLGLRLGLSDFHKQLMNAQSYYQKACSALKAATTPNHPLTFQQTYVSLRARQLACIVQLMKACSSFHTSPPPAIATSLAVTTGQEIHRYEHVVNALLKCSVQLERVMTGFSELQQMSFDADPASLSNLHVLRQSCQVMMYILDTLLNTFQRGKHETKPSFSFLASDDGLLIEHQPWKAAFEQMMETLQDTTSQPAEAPLTHQHMTCLQKVALIMARVPLCLPRYFFQSLQETSIKLAISPQPRSPPDPVSVHYDTHLTLKVEGVIQHGSSPGLYRSVAEVELSVKSAQQSRSQMVSEVKVQDNPTNAMTQRATPHNDYFSAQFLLAFPIAGLHLVTIDTAVVDENGVVWQTGPSSTLSVKSYDEAAQRQQQQQYAQQRQQQQRAQPHTQSVFS